MAACRSIYTLAATSLLSFNACASETQAERETIAVFRCSGEIIDTPNPDLVYADVAEKSSIPRGWKPIWIKVLAKINGDPMPDNQAVTIPTGCSDISVKSFDAGPIEEQELLAEVYLLPTDEDKFRVNDPMLDKILVLDGIAVQIPR